MDLNHGDPEKNGLVANVVRIWPSERLLAEIAKCNVVCANCHREHTLGSGVSTWTLRTWLEA